MDGWCCRTPEHHVELGVAQDEAVGLVDERDVGVFPERFGEPRRQLQPTEAGAKHDHPHRVLGFEVGAVSLMVSTG